MPRSSACWEHFERDDSTKTAECNYCRKSLSYKTTITNLKNHLKQKHERVYDELMSTQENWVKTPPVTKTNSPVWNYFQIVDSVTHVAECIFCKKNISYNSTTGNLKSHLKYVHEEAYEKVTAAEGNTVKNNCDNTAVEESNETQRTRKKRSAVWNHFLETDAVAKTAECNYCNKSFSYFTTNTNLKQHLRLIHPEVYKVSFLGGKNRSHTKNSLESHSDQSDSSDEEAEEFLKLSDVWSYFEESGGKAKCVVCRESVENEYEELKAHLKDNHPKLLLQIMQDKDDNSNAGSSHANDDDNTYTEIVYLEHDTLAEESPKKREKPRSTVKITPNIAKKRERRISSDDYTPKIAKKRERRVSSDDVPLKRKNEDENNELGSFIKYITCLLKKLPPHAFSEVQIEIINTILKANVKASSSHAVVHESPQIILNEELIKSTIPNVITVNDITPIDSAAGGHNYTITVSSNNKEGEFESS